ncbi:MAG: hypothetical protein DRJ11_02250 [Candidatus Aminicenantes bacterium]|nr:hypothetical protein [Candidatus Aminicenantes bacterium]RLE04074.1 MAG: hypothetical protein DRJ11_02250 [Candidatus Aminicenantes bacterium]
MHKFLSSLFLVLSIIFSILGIAFFLFLFLPEFNIYWLILAPVILTIYQLPAVGLFWLHKKFKNEHKPSL